MKTLKNKIVNKELIFGPLLYYGSAELVQTVSQFEFDFVWIDCQHGQFTETILLDTLGRFSNRSIYPIVRVRDNDTGIINRTLDMGALGIVVPMIENKDQSINVVNACYYPPEGKRSGGGIRLDWILGNNIDYIKESNSYVITIVMVETVKSIKNIEEICQVENLDIILIGPGDLMIDIKANNRNEEYHEELVIEALEKILDNNKCAGYVCTNKDILSKRVNQGFKFIVYGHDHTIITTEFKKIENTLSTFNTS